MTKYLLLLFGLTLINCKKTTASPTAKKVDSAKIIDSINTARTKINDQIRNRNRFGDLSGKHLFSHNAIAAKGVVNFEKVKGDHDVYLVNGNIVSGKYYAKIVGTAMRVSDRHFNFTGEISQSTKLNDNGKTFVRSGTKTFLSKDGGKTWRLQDMVNASGFVDYIDIKL